MSNYEWLKTLNAGGLADAFCKHGICPLMDNPICCFREDFGRPDCRECWIDWLASEHEEEREDG